MNDCYDLEKLRGRAIALFSDGYNCAQAVAAAWAPEFEVSREDALKLAAALGGGVSGTHQGTCGAILGGLMAIGAATQDASSLGKKTANEQGQELLKEFEGRNGSCICEELLEQPDIEERSADDIRLQSMPEIRPCARFVADAVDMVYVILLKQA